MAQELSGTFRWVVSGEPIQNSKWALNYLFDFVGSSPGDRQVLKKWNEKRTGDHVVVESDEPMLVLLRGFMLRHRVEDAAKVIKTEEFVAVQLTELERFIYDKISFVR